jgi:hypothetical protein
MLGFIVIKKLINEFLGNEGSGFLIKLYQEYYPI